MQEKNLSFSHQDHIARGVIYGLAAMFLLAVMYACSKLLSDTHHVIEIVFYRNIIALVPLLIYLILSKKTRLLRTKKPIALTGRVFLGSVGLVATLATFALLPMADATVIILTSVLLVPAMAFFTLGERIGPHRWAAIAIGLAGVVLMARPSGHIEMLGIMIGFTTALLQAGTQVFLRHLKTEDSFTVTFYFILGGVLISGPFVPFLGHMPSLAEVPMILGIGVSGALAQYFLTSAFRSAPAGVVAPLNYTGLIWASLFDILIWHKVPGLAVFGGAAVIIASQAYILHRERIAGKK